MRLKNPTKYKRELSRVIRAEARGVALVACDWYIDTNSTCNID